MKRDFIIILTSVLLYLLNNSSIQYYSNKHIFWFMTCYFNDIVGSVAFLGYCNILLATQNRRIHRLTSIVLIMLACGFVWEYLAPVFRSDTFTDLFDFGAYIFGGFIYWLLVRGKKPFWNTSNNLQ